MSIPLRGEEKCCMCGTTSKQTFLLITSQSGASDLDSRPSEPKRSTMSWWVHECPSCGYVSDDLSEDGGVTKEWLKTNAYLTCDNRMFKSELAAKFYKWYLIKIENGRYKSAFYSVLNAAWACDDVQDVENAVYCRTKALEEYRRFAVDKDEKELYAIIKADLLRRTGNFKLLIKEYRWRRFSDKLFDKIRVFQIKKAKQKDTACYTTADVE